MLQYRVLYRKLHKYKDTIFDVWATGVDDLLKKLPERGVHFEQCQYVFAHEYRGSSVKEVITYEHEEDKVTNKPRIKLKHRTKEQAKQQHKPVWKLSGRFVTEGRWTAYEVISA